MIKISDAVPELNQEASLTTKSSVRGTVGNFPKKSFLSRTHSSTIMGTNGGYWGHHRGPVIYKKKDQKMSGLHHSTAIILTSWIILVVLWWIRTSTRSLHLTDFKLWYNSGERSCNGRARIHWLHSFYLRLYMLVLTRIWTSSHTSARRFLLPQTILYPIYTRLPSRCKIRLEYRLTMRTVLFDRWTFNRLLQVNASSPFLAEHH
jgi:hypothetical protein